MDEEKLNELYRQYESTRSAKKRRDLYKAIKRTEAKRRKEKIKDVIVI